MSDDVQFDNHVREQLGNYTPDVPPHIWDNIVAKRGSRRTGGLWLWFFSGKGLLLTALLLTAGAAYLLLSSPAAAPGTSTAARQTSSGSNTITPASTGTPAGSAAATPGINATANNNEGSSTAALPGNTGIPAASAAQGANTGAATNTLSKTGTAAGSSVAAVSSPGSRPAAGAGSNGGSYSPLTFSPSAVNRFVKRKPAPHHLPLRQPEAAGAPASAKAVPPAPEDLTNGSENPVAAAATSLTRMLSEAGRLQADKESVTGLRSRKLYSILLPDCPTVEDNAAGNKRYFELYGGPDLGMRSLSSFAGDTASANYLQKRKETASFTSAFSAGIRYTRVFSSGMSLRTGVNYSQINEKFKYVNPNDIRYILVITPRQVIINGTPSTVYDTLRYTQTGTRVRTTYNRYRTVDIPLQLGYEFGNGRLHTNISAGAVVNLYSWQRGDVLDSAYQPVSITTGKGSSAYGFKTNIGVGFLGSVSVYYKLGSRLHLLAEPYIRYNLKPMSRETQGFTQKYNTAGLRLGLRWDLK